MKRAKSILDPGFRYVNSAKTDLRKTFARIRREQRTQKPAGDGAPIEPDVEHAAVSRPKSA